MLDKNKFKELRSGYRKLESNAYFSSRNSKQFGEALAKLKSEYSEVIGFDCSFFGKFDKPVVRDLIVSMPVFRALDYPFKKFEALL